VPSNDSTTARARWRGGLPLPRHQTRRDEVLELALHLTGAGAGRRDDLAQVERSVRMGELYSGRLTRSMGRSQR
jgi:hypothetical protein